MKKLIVKFIMMVAVAISFTSCEKSDAENVEVTGTGATTIELAPSGAVSATGTTATSVVTVNYIVGEKLFPNKVIPKLTLYYLVGTTSSSTRTAIYSATNVALTATPTPAAQAPVVTAIGAYGNPSNIVWGLKYTFNLSALGTGLTSTTNGVTTSSRGTSVILVAQDAANNILAEYTFAISEFGLRTI